MGLFGQLMQTAGEKLSKTKEQREQEEAFVRNNEGSKAICAYIADFFEKGNPGYAWLKENKFPLYPVINKDSVSLCYMHTGDGMPKDAEVGNYSFQEMYSWYGLAEGIGYSSLTSRTQMNVLEQMINSEVEKLPHIKFNGGYLVKMFQ